MRDGDPVIGQACPKCQRETVVYNGNYLCARCDWSMGNNHKPERIVATYLEQRINKAKAAGDDDEVARLSAYLRQYDGVRIR